MFLFGRERKAAKAAKAKAAAAATSGAQKRQAFRAAIQMPVSYLIPSERNPHRRIGIARDISAGGMKLMTERGFQAGTHLELRFTLPNKFLDGFAKEVRHTEVSPFGERVRKVQKAVRHFQEMEIPATIVRSTPEGEKFALAIRFHKLDPHAEEEIARFNHYWQLWAVQKRKEAAER
ncbi:MAG TPA: PilZ domain-containing protein [Candidatus Binatia bacterium]|nr:PilZ domain-containing protein [Candidatus Binatia bacterium]